MAPEFLLATRQSYEEFLNPSSSANNNSDSVSKSPDASGINSSSSSGNEKASDVGSKQKRRRRQKNRDRKGKSKAVSQGKLYLPILVRLVTSSEKILSLSEINSESEETKFQKAGLTDEDDREILAAVVANRTSQARKRQADDHEGGSGPSTWATTPPPRKRVKKAQTASVMTGPPFNQPQPSTGATLSKGSSELIVCSGSYAVIISLLVLTFI